MLYTKGYTLHTKTSLVTARQYTTTNKKMLTAVSTWYPTGLEVTKDTEHGSVGKRRKSLLIGTAGIPRSTLAASCAGHMISIKYTTQL